MNSVDDDLRATTQHGRISRREAVKRAVLASGAFALPSIVPSRVFAANSPSKVITVGFIGVGSHGRGYNLSNFLNHKDCRVIAVCDVFRDRRVAAKRKVDGHYANRDCSMYEDFRDLLARDDIDAVCISTPDHWHVPMSLMALQSGKHVICEKPTLTIEQGRRLADAVQKQNKVFATGLEDRSLIHYHKLVEAVRNGAIGNLTHITVGLITKKKVWEIQEPQPIPEDFNYKLWLGPAPDQPYTPNRVATQGWRVLRDYSAGNIADWGTHLVDTAQVGNFAEKTSAVKVQGTGFVPANAMNEHPTDFSLSYEFANGVSMQVDAGEPSIRFEGDKGWCECIGWRGKMDAHDKQILKQNYENSRVWPRPELEHRNFLDSIHSGKQPTYPAEDLHRLSTTLHIGNIAMLLERPLQWDPKTEQFVNDDEANAMRSRPESTRWMGE